MIDWDNKAKEIEQEIIEILANLEHEQWMYWASSLIKNKEVTEEKIKKWKKYMIPYKDLSEEIKERDRVWARKALNLISK